MRSVSGGHAPSRSPQKGGRKEQEPGKEGRAGHLTMPLSYLDCNSLASPELVRAIVLNQCKRARANRSEGAKHTMATLGERVHVSKDRSCLLVVLILF